MANYGLTNSSNYGTQPAMGATYTTQLAVAASSGSIINAPTITGLRRGKIYDILVGTNGTPADNYVEWIVHRLTVSGSLAYVGSISSVSSQFALDTADAAYAAFSVANTSGNSSTVFTLFNQPVWYVGVNQRASYRWVAAPGSEMVYPAVSSATGGNGLGLAARSAAYTGTGTTTLLFQEQ